MTYHFILSRPDLHETLTYHNNAVFTTKDRDDVRVTMTHHFVMSPSDLQEILKYITIMLYLQRETDITCCHFILTFLNLQDIL